MPRLVASLLALPVIFATTSSVAAATTTSEPTAQLLRQARIACAQEVRLGGPKEYAICVDDVMMAGDLGELRTPLQKNNDETTLSVDQQWMRRARMACAAVGTGVRPIHPSPQVTGTPFDQCVEEVVHTRNVAAAAFWVEGNHTAEQEQQPQQLRGASSLDPQAA